MYLLDTNVVSELRRPKPHGALLAWIDSVADADLHISAVTVGEIQGGVELARKNDPIKAIEVEHWLDQVVATFNIIPMDVAAFREWARLMHGRSSDLTEDAMIAATALVHRLIVVTRNTKDFAELGLDAQNPFKR